MFLVMIVAAIAAAVAAAYALWRVRLGYRPATMPGVLAYHKITRFELGGTWVPPGRFVSQIDALIDAGFSFIDEEAFLRTVEGEREGTNREVLLTFDDGYEELLHRAVPALEERKIRALIFLVSSYVGRENMWELNLPGRRFMHMGWDEIRDLRARGFDFGSHTRTHRDLTRLPSGTAREELVSSKEELESRIGCVIKSLSYPFGRTNGMVSAEASKAGYRAAFSMYPSSRNSSVDPLALRREGVYIIDAVFNLKSKLGAGPFFWLEDIKGRAINGVAVLTPLLKGNLSDL